MPKAREEKVTVSADGRIATVETSIGERGTTKELSYKVPATAASFQEMVATLKTEKDGGAFIKLLLGDEYGLDENETPLDFAYRMFRGAIDRVAKASVYESIAAESTFITVGKDRKNLLDLPVSKLIVAINGNIGHREMKLTLVNAPEQSAIDAEQDPATKAALVAQRAQQEKEVDRSMGFGPWRATAKKLVEGYEKEDGVKVPPQAKWNADGTLASLVTA